jgi:hypothetical protein
MTEEVIKNSPRVYKPTVWLTPRASYSVDFERMTVKIASVGELPILGYPRAFLTVLISLN